MNVIAPKPDPSARRRPQRLLVLAVAGILLIAGTLAYCYFRLARPIGQGPAGPAVPREPFVMAWTTRKVLLLGVGDSITAGFGASKGHSYFELLAASPSDEFPEMQGISLSAVLPKLESRNLAVSGSTSLHHLDTLQERFETQDAETLGIVVMTTGGNDIIHNYGRTPAREGAMYGATLAQARPWVAAYEKRLHAMIDLLEARFPGGCHIFLADIYDPTDSVGDASGAGLPPWPDGLAIHRAYNDVIHRCAAQRASVRLVPLHGDFLGHGIYCAQFWRPHYRRHDPHYWYADNLEDPNDRGYDAIRRLFLLQVVKIAPEL